MMIHETYPGDLVMVGGQHGLDRTWAKRLKSSGYQSHRLDIRRGETGHRNPYDLGMLIAKAEFSYVLFPDMMVWMFRDVPMHLSSLKEAL